MQEHAVCHHISLTAKSAKQKHLGLGSHTQSCTRGMLGRLPLPGGGLLRGAHSTGTTSFQSAAPTYLSSLLERGAVGLELLQGLGGGKERASLYRVCLWSGCLSLCRDPPPPASRAACSQGVLAPQAQTLQEPKKPSESGLLKPRPQQPHPRQPRPQPRPLTWLYCSFYLRPRLWAEHRLKVEEGWDERPLRRL